MATKRARTVRREDDRARKKDLEARLALAKLEVGGAPERPLVVVSASVVEPQALGLACIACDAVNGRLVEHVVAPHAGEILRLVTTRCFECGSTAKHWFRISPPRLN